VEVLHKEKSWLGELKLDVSSPFLEENLGTVLAAIENLNTFHSLGLEESVIRQGLQQVKQSTYFIGRWEKLGEHPLILGDSAHNEAGLKHVIEKIREIPHRELHIVLGVTKEKDLNKLFALLPKEARYYFAKADIPRGLDASKLAQEANQAGFTGKSYVSVRNALNAARRQATPEDLIYVGGSIFTLAEVL
jgi:dihydrofolate synthase/folylpolyglutamate synthase